ncbi:MAG: universal stress protein [Ktedonobacterales bacterium]
MGLLERLGLPTGRATKIIDGLHPELPHTSGNTPKPDMLPLPAGEDGQRAHTKRNVLVAITGHDLDCETVTMACNIAKMKKAGVYAIYGIEVPRKLAIDAELPQETEAASEALERAAAVADQMHMRIDPEIVQSRNFGQSLVDEARAHECALVILGLPYHVGIGGRFDLGETADYVLKNAPCRVWLIRGQRPEGAERAERAERRESISTTL